MKCYPNLYAAENTVNTNTMMKYMQHMHCRRFLAMSPHILCLCEDALKWLDMSIRF